MSHGILQVILILLTCLVVDCSEECSCIPLTQCPTFLRYYLSLKKPLSESSIIFLRSKQCGIQDKSIKVCCEDNFTTTTITSTTQMLPKNKCEDSQCISLKYCTPVLQFLNTVQKPLDACIVNYLRNEQCGFEEGFPKICCKSIPKYLRKQINYKNKPKQKSTTASKDVDKNHKYNDETVNTATLESKTQLSILKTFSSDVGKKKIHEVNRELSEFFDDGDSFDLLLRQQRSLDADMLIDVEIR
ncbi:uncharacterized protein LOC130443887 [Diorhabda sublineata]|uniref:uncharacterized protein LOC130443887 n=1 Tax=Diorhabda sublineata TaxID=1163346 RepID=UPI0024E161FF|nr:uncharacterized protein LOC130443887 [Diorhabda sublineata]